MTNIRQHLYVAGPMQGYHHHNALAFKQATELLRQAGCLVTTPAENYGGDQTEAEPRYARADLHHLLQCDGIVLLPGWEMSKGATIEVAVGRWLGLQFFTIDVAEKSDGIMGIPLFPVELAHLPDPCLLFRIAHKSHAWAEQTFPDSGPSAKAAHLLKEARELFDSPTDPEEMADIFLLLANLAGYCSFDLGKLADAKMQKNQARRWGKPDAAGVVEHIRDEAMNQERAAKIIPGNWRAGSKGLVCYFPAGLPVSLCGSQGVISGHMLMSQIQCGDCFPALIKVATATEAGQGVDG